MFNYCSSCSRNVPGWLIDTLYTEIRLQAPEPLRPPRPNSVLFVIHKSWKGGVGGGFLLWLEKGFFCRFGWQHNFMVLLQSSVSIISLEVDIVICAVCTKCKCELFWIFYQYWRLKSWVNTASRQIQVLMYSHHISHVSSPAIRTGLRVMNMSF